MKESKPVITRRDFLRTSSYMAMGSLIALPLMSRAADTRYGLGNSQPARIELIKLGWEEGVLI